jgi:hypothetical protein
VQVDIGSDLTLTAMSASVIRTFADGALATVTVADVQAGESIVVAGRIDRSDPTTPVFDIGRAFVWAPTSS